MSRTPTTALARLKGAQRAVLRGLGAESPVPIGSEGLHECFRK
jgi:hypothetical protein